MFSIILFVCFILATYGRKTTSDEDNDWSLLLQHKSGTSINKEESAALDNVLNTYNGQNQKLAKDVFTTMVNDAFEFEESRNLVDIEGDDISYQELVYVLTQISDILNLFLSDDDKIMMSDIFGKYYTTNTEPECITQLILAKMDTTKSNIISFDYFKDHIINTWWTEIDNTETGFITNDQFKDLFLESQNWNQFKDQIIYQQNGKFYDGEAIYTSLKSSTTEDIKSTILTMKPHQFDQAIEDYENLEQTTTFGPIFAIPPLVVAGAWFVARVAVRVAVGATIAAIGATPAH